jgi:hypothetical protein
MTTAATPKIFCDFNKLIDDNVYSLEAIGSRDDIAKSAVALRAGVPIIVYEADYDSAGNPVWLTADAVVVDLGPVGWGARVDPQSWRNEPRQ